MQRPAEPAMPWFAPAGPSPAAPEPPLAAAVAAIVAIAALRARAAGQLGALRDAVAAAIDAAEEPAADPDESGLPAIADADPRLEFIRLSRLARRLGPA